MNVLEGLLQTIVAHPQGGDRWLVLADWLEENDDPRRADLLRLHQRLLATCCKPDQHPERRGWHARIVELLGQSVKPCVPQRTVVLGEGVEMTFSFIPPGSFLMGSPDGESGRKDDETLHQVTLTRGFFLGIYPVTQAQWTAVMGNNPSGWMSDADLTCHPVQRINEHRCQLFCQRLGEKTRWHYRLPTEAEWEYACRAGSTTAYWFGETISTYQANCDCYFGQVTTPVGMYGENAWGLYDLHGNVGELCNDWYGPYPEKECTDPQGSSDGEARVQRGGAYGSDPQDCRSATRGRFHGSHYDDYGCRIVLCLD